MTAARWKIELLGGLCVSGGVRVTHFRTRKAASLLAYLILHPKRQSRETLTDAFWPDADFDAARTSFRVSLTHIRKELGDDFLDAGRDTIAIAAPFVCDVVEFEQAVRAKRWNDAARLYSGPLLPGFWDDWIVTERERLEALYETVRQHISEAMPELPLHLPPDLNRFFGREDEIEQMGEMLTQNRLVTLLGPGGIGKTRLSLAAARRHAALFPGGLWFVSLADVMTPERILPTIRDSLDLPRNATETPLTQIAERLKGELHCLLILDNFEQIAAQGASLVPSLLSRTPNLTVLVSSRRRLGVPGERQKTVSPLAPEASVALFSDRASVAPSEDIAALCRELEGVPLAIELCAARAGVFSVAEMREKLTERFALLASTDTEKTARHRSLFAAMDWSYRLLTPEQRRFFGGLSAFRGGWTREAAERVCDEPSASEYLGQLRERSLILSEELDGSIRFRMLESLREFAEERLSKGERRELERRHTDFFRDFALECEPKLSGADSKAWLDRLEADHENLRIVPASVAFASALWWFWYQHGHWTEGRARLASALQEPLPTESEAIKNRAKALDGAGVLSYSQGDYETALTLGEGSLALRREIGFQKGVASSLNNLGNILRDKGDYAGAKARYEEGLRVSQELGNAAFTASLSLSLGVVLAEQGDSESAKRYYRQSLRARREIGDLPGVSVALNNLGNLAIEACDYGAAKVSYRESLSIGREIGDHRMIAYAAGNLSSVFVEEGDLAQAQTLLEESLAIRRELGDRQGIAYCLDSLGMIAQIRGEFAQARTLYVESLTLRRELEDRRSAAQTLEAMASLDAAQGATTRAAQLWGAAEALREEVGAPLPLNERLRNEKQIAAARAASNAETFAVAWREGRALTLEQALALALASDSRA